VPLKKLYLLLLFICYTHTPLLQVKSTAARRGQKRERRTEEVVYQVPVLEEA